MDVTDFRPSICIFQGGQADQEQVQVRTGQIAQRGNRSPSAQNLGREGRAW